MTNDRVDEHASHVPQYAAEAREARTRPARWGDLRHDVLEHARRWSLNAWKQPAVRWLRAGARVLCLLALVVCVTPPLRAAAHPTEEPAGGAPPTAGMGTRLIDVGGTT